MPGALTTLSGAFCFIQALSQVALALLLTACHSSSQLQRLNWSSGEISSAQFQHRYLAREAQSTAVAAGTTPRLHVYLEGDGRPFVSVDRVALDPTPVRSVVMPLMRRDPHAVLYLSRPCYDGLQNAACHPRLWTIARYSDDVVAAMTEVIQQLWQAHGQPQLTLIGHSGGGTLALLIAARLPGIYGVITLAGNLNPGAWAQHHDFSPLTQSLSPVNQRLSDQVRELHLVGGLDSNLPRVTVLDYLQDATRQHEHFDVCELPGCGHSDCWQRIWAQVIVAWEADQMACKSITDL